MTSRVILQSIKLDSTCSLVGVPHYKPGKQPSFPPDVTTTTNKLSTTDIQDVIQKLNNKFQVRETSWAGSATLEI